MDSVSEFSFDESRFKLQVGVMLRMQEELNLLVFPDWKQRKLGWHRAIYVEAAEYLEHLATWKWWKKGTPDFAQANMELVDIWHFGLSWYLDRFCVYSPSSMQAMLISSVKQACLKLPAGLNPALIEQEARYEAVDQLVASAGGYVFDLEAFVTLLAYSGMTFDTLYRRYVGKNVLNRFRQERGYKLGTYSKNWDGQEDNQHLESILDGLPLDERLPENVHAQLTAAYDSRVV